MDHEPFLLVAGEEHGRIVAAGDFRRVTGARLARLAGFTRREEVTDEQLIDRSIVVLASFE
jgi:hypothetical protein